MLDGVIFFFRMARWYSIIAATASCRGCGETASNGEGFVEQAEKWLPAACDVVARVFNMRVGSRERAPSACSTTSLCKSSEVPGAPVLVLSTGDCIIYFGFE